MFVCMILDLMSWINEFQKVLVLTCKPAADGVSKDSFLVREMERVRPILVQRAGRFNCALTACDRLVNVSNYDWSKFIGSGVKILENEDGIEKFKFPTVSPTGEKGLAIWTVGGDIVWDLFDPLYDDGDTFDSLANAYGRFMLTNGTLVMVPQPFGIESVYRVARMIGGLPTVGPLDPLHEKLVSNRVSLIVDFVRIVK